MVRLAEDEFVSVTPPASPHWSFGNVSLYPPPAPSWSPKTPPPRQRVATEPQVAPLWPTCPGRTSSSIPQPERIRPPITAPLTARTSGAAIVGCPTSSADGDASRLRPTSARCGSEGISPAITFAEASKMPPPRTYSSVAHPLGHGSAIVPEYLSRSPLAPTRQLVAEATRWKESYLREREPLLTHSTVQGLQKVHDEWHRESASQKALLHVHLAAAVERLECLESNETRHLEHIKEPEQRAATLVQTRLGGGYLEARWSLVAAEASLQRSRECVLLCFGGGREMWVQWTSSGTASKEDHAGIEGRWGLFDSAQRVVFKGQRPSLDDFLTELEASYEGYSTLERLFLGETLLWTRLNDQNGPNDPNDPNDETLLCTRPPPVEQQQQEERRAIVPFDANTPTPGNSPLGRRPGIDEGD